MQVEDPCFALVMVLVHLVKVAELHQVLNLFLALKILVDLVAEIYFLLAQGYYSLEKEMTQKNTPNAALILRATFVCSDIKLCVDLQYTNTKCHSILRFYLSLVLQRMGLPSALTFQQVPRCHLAGGEKGTACEILHVCSDTLYHRTLPSKQLQRGIDHNTSPSGMCLCKGSLEKVAV
eukprot:g47366.t1